MRIVIDHSVSDDPGVGEIIVYGPVVMRGYFNRPRENQEVFTADGGLRTGDLGYLDDDDYLVVTGRIKELFKLDNGKYVMPVPLEESLRLSPYILDVMVWGANRPYGVALAVVNVDALAEWGRRERHVIDDPAHDPAVRDLIAHEVNERTRPFPAYARPRKLALLTEPFTPENGLLTPTLKLRRQSWRPATRWSSSSSTARPRRPGDRRPVRQPAGARVAAARRAEPALRHPIHVTLERWRAGSRSWFWAWCW